MSHKDLKKLTAEQTPFSDMVDTEVDDNGVHVKFAAYYAFDAYDAAIKNFRGNHVYASCAAQGVLPKISTEDAIARKASSVACDICKKEFTTSSQKCLEHDHATGTVRGVVCASCNLHLGYLEKFIR